MMDEAGTEILQRRRREHGEQQSDARRRLTGEIARKLQRPGQEDEQQPQRPYRHRDPLGQCGRQYRLAGRHQNRER